MTTATKGDIALRICDTFSLVYIVKWQPINRQSIRSIAASAVEQGSKLKVSTRGQVPPFKVMDVMREANLAANGRDILHLEVGQPLLVHLLV